MALDGISWRGVLGRFLAATALVYTTYNPEGVSFFHWVFRPLALGVGPFVHSLNPLKLLAAIALAAGWVVFVQATKRSLGTGGTLLVVALLGCLIWALVYYGVFSATSSRAIGHLILLVISLVLALGMSWSHVSRRLSGQMDIDEVG
jgi:uncharacterized protein DUF6524